MSGESSQNTGDQFASLFRKYKDRTYDFAVKMLNDREAAGDIVQEVFLRLFKNLNNHSRISDYRSWIFICTRNICLNHIRDSRKFVPIDNDREDYAQPPNVYNSQLHLLRKALDTLDVKHREILILKAYMGFTYQEIAAILDITIPSVKSTLFQARTRLRAAMEKKDVMR